MSTHFFHITSFSNGLKLYRNFVLNFDVICNIDILIHFLKNFFIKCLLSRFSCQSIHKVIRRICRNSMMIRLVYIKKVTVLSHISTTISNKRHHNIAFWLEKFTFLSPALKKNVNICSKMSTYVFSTCFSVFRLSLVCNIDYYISSRKISVTIFLSCFIL